jgi:hypothetical protein
MSGATQLLPLYVFVAFTETTLPFFFAFRECFFYRVSLRVPRRMQAVCAVKLPSSGT